MAYARVSGCCCCYCVPQSAVGIVTNCGKFEGLAAPGIHFTDPCRVGIKDAVSLRIQTMSLRVQSKTKENVFVNLHIEVQFQVLPGAVDVAFYYLNNPRVCIEAYVSANIRASIPSFTLDELYLERQSIATQIKTNVDNKMDEFGFDILAVLITDIQPDSGVKGTMDKLLAARRLQIAAHDSAEAECVLAIKRAEASAELARLSAVGVANQRRELLKGLEFGVEAMREALPEYSTDELLHLLMTNQYLDVVREVAAQGESHGNNKSSSSAPRKANKNGGDGIGGGGYDANGKYTSSSPTAMSLKAGTGGGGQSTANEQLLQSSEQRLEAMESEYADAYPRAIAEMKDGTIDKTDRITKVMKLREMYTDIQELKKRVVQLKADVAKEKKAAEAFQLSGANVNQADARNKNKNNKKKFNSSDDESDADFASTAAKNSNGGGGGGAGMGGGAGPLHSQSRRPHTGDALYMPHVTALRDVARQLITVATETSVPVEARERGAAMLAMAQQQQQRRHQNPPPPAAMQ